jgi:hypothetical protein
MNTARTKRVIRKNRKERTIAKMAATSSHLRYSRGISMHLVWPELFVKPRGHLKQTSELEMLLISPARIKYI